MGRRTEKIKRDYFKCHTLKHDDYRADLISNIIKRNKIRRKMTKRVASSI